MWDSLGLVTNVSGFKAQPCQDSVIKARRPATEVKDTHTALLLATPNVLATLLSITAPYVGWRHRQKLDVRYHGGVNSKINQWRTLLL